jgi:hypothetical protein
MAATTTLLDLVTPTQGTLSGTWGDTVNYGISDYLDIAIAGTLTFTGDGAITLTNTIGSASGNNIGATTGQYMVIRVTGTLTTPKIITAPSRSKLYMVDNAATGSTVSFIRAGQTPAVSIAVGEKAFVYYNGTDYVKVASSVADGVTTIDFGSTGLTPNTATSGAVTVAGTLAIANGGTGTTSTTFVNLASNVTGTLPANNGGTGVANNAASTLAISGNFATTLTVSGVTGVTLPTTGTLSTLAGSETLTNKTLTTPIISTISNTGTLTLPTSTDTLVGRATTDTLTNKTLTSPTLTTPVLGTPSSGTLSSCTVDGTNAVGYRAIPQSGSAKTTSYTLAVGDVGEFIEVGASGSIVVPNSTFAAGDAVVIFNNTSGAITLTMSITTAYIGGTDADKATISLATRGVCNVLFISGTVCVVTGNVT